MFPLTCSFCDQELNEPGGLYFSPPVTATSWVVVKAHVCVVCCEVIENLRRQGLVNYSNDNIIS